MQCPKCLNSIEQDFGVFSCPHCNSILFIDIEGKVQISDEIDTPPHQELPPLPPMPQRPAFAPLPPVPKKPKEPSAINLSDYSSSRPDATSENLHAEEIVESASQIIPSTESIVNLSAELTSYSNSEELMGNLSYHLCIEGIDTSEIRDRVYDALSDRRFKWDAREILQKMKFGKIEISRLNPAKAAVIVKRLMEVPVQIKWEQKRLES